MSGGLFQAEVKSGRSRRANLSRTHKKSVCILSAMRRHVTAERSREEDPAIFLMKFTCPILCTYGEKDHDMSSYPKIVCDVFSSTKHADSTVRVFEGAEHQLEVTNGKRVTGRALHKYRHKEVDPLILVWILKRFPATPRNSIRVGCRVASPYDRRAEQRPFLAAR
jgi:hypothetical protein